MNYPREYILNQNTRKFIGADGEWIDGAENAIPVCSKYHKVLGARGSLSNVCDIDSILHSVYIRRKDDIHYGWQGFKDEADAYRHIGEYCNLNRELIRQLMNDGHLEFAGMSYWFWKLPVDTQRAA